MHCVSSAKMNRCTAGANAATRTLLLHHSKPYPKFLFGPSLILKIITHEFVHVLIKKVWDRLTPATGAAAEMMAPDHRTTACGLPSRNAPLIAPSRRRPSRRGERFARSLARSPGTRPRVLRCGPSWRSNLSRRCRACRAHSHRQAGP